ncbi:hypothetical protein [Clostridium chrysemydis]|uniref:hypothetical protein n=1 Tax=Clostridium chrysemydis TaxID=2665504 RepID=UPI0018843454|nr:hypothetical protein [Clostridium chrysemydis]
MSNKIIRIYKESFRTNIYTRNHFRMIGLLDVIINFDGVYEKVTLAYYRSSGTNDGKIEGLWYPIVGIKLENGEFTEFTKEINNILKSSTKKGVAKKGWLAKSVFFRNKKRVDKALDGFSYGSYYDELFRLGKLLRHLYERKNYFLDENLNGEKLNKIVLSNNIYPNNKFTQRENYERFLRDIYLFK